MRFRHGVLIMSFSCSHLLEDTTWLQPLLKSAFFVAAFGVHSQVDGTAIIWNPSLQEEFQHLLA